MISCICRRLMLHAGRNEMQNVSALLSRRGFLSGMCRPAVLAAKVHRTERLLHRAAQEARQACVESNPQKVAHTSNQLAPRRLLLAPEHGSSIAARSPEQPWPIRLVRAGQAHWPLCFEPAAYTLRRHRGEWREVVVCDVRRARARRHDGHLECIASTKEY